MSPTGIGKIVENILLSENINSEIIIIIKMEI